MGRSRGAADRTHKGAVAANCITRERRAHIQSWRRSCVSLAPRQRANVPVGSRSNLNNCVQCSETKDEGCAPVKNAKSWSSLWVLRRNSRQLRFAGFALGLILAQGAPLGLVLHFSFLGPHLDQTFGSIFTNRGRVFSIYFYVWVGTSIYFSAFGYAMAWLMAGYLGQLQRSQSALSLFGRYDEMKRSLRHGHSQSTEEPGRLPRRILRGNTSWTVR